MRSLDNVIDAILAHLRSWPAFYADPSETSGGRTSGGGTPQIPPASAAPVPGGGTPQIPPATAAPVPGCRTPGGRTPGGRAWDGRSASHRAWDRRPANHRPPTGRDCYRVAPTEWGATDVPVTASQPAEKTAGRADGDHEVRQARTAGPPARRRCASFLGASPLPQPRGLLTCSPEVLNR